MTYDGVGGDNLCIIAYNDLLLHVMLLGWARWNCYYTTHHTVIFKKRFCGSWQAIITCLCVMSNYFWRIWIVFLFFFILILSSIHVFRQSSSVVWVVVTKRIRGYNNNYTYYLWSKLFEKWNTFSCHSTTYHVLNYSQWKTVLKKKRT